MYNKSQISAQTVHYKPTRAEPCSPRFWTPAFGVSERTDAGELTSLICPTHQEVFANQMRNKYNIASMPLRHIYSSSTPDKIVVLPSSTNTEASGARST